MAISVQKRLIDWFDTNQRDLPWRKSDAWGVLVSEFMLQQTPVNRVLPVWNEWLHRWPRPIDFAQESSAEVLRAWGKLGYPRRALALHQSAKLITENYGGIVPKDYESLLALPGVGDYTASAILAFAYQKPALVLDTNIRRFFSRYFDGESHPKSTVSRYEKEIRAKLIPQVNGHKWAAATMEFGALICTATSPKCEQCFLAKQCAWLAAGKPESEHKKVKQAKFEGSDRQCRGVIVNHLRENTLATHSTLKNLWPDKSQFERAVASLIADKLIENFSKNSYRLGSPQT
jgi:A/G-specific adenine glycosylase